MQVITSHTGTDFDGLASMVAARKLYPEARAVFSGGADRNVRDYMNLFGRDLGVLYPSDAQKLVVERLIVVDCMLGRRLGIFADLALSKEVEIHLFDHHPPTNADLHGQRVVVEPLGACTTVLLKQLDAAGLSYDPIEATLFALGIYEETGSLTFSHTTPDDLLMVARLLEAKANLDIVSSYINRSLSEEQRNLLNALILNAEYSTIHGVTIAISTAQVKTYVDEIALLAHKLCDIENVGAVFVIVETVTGLFAIGRSKVDSVDVGALLSEMGGGGHHRAASAVLKSSSLAQAREQLEAALPRYVRPIGIAAEIMSHPVRSVNPETTVEEAGRVMLRYGHSGLLVVENERIVGIISRRDVDKARHHGLYNAPVKACMTHHVHAAAPTATFHELERMMVDANVGRIPIVDGDRIAGIVTRTDILTALYGYTKPGQRRTFQTVDPEIDNVAAIVAEVLDPGLVRLLEEVGAVGDELGLNCFVVGGFVRDLLLRHRNLDVDILVEGPAIDVAAECRRRLDGRLTTHQRFGTAVLVTVDGRKLDFASARTEFYEFPAAPPEVEFSSVREDLYRRDFTINAMAVQVNRGNWGRLLDFFGGRQDLSNGLVRVLHNLSFVEDPTRLLRAVRFEQRYGLTIEPHTEALMSEITSSHILSKPTNERLRDEFILLLEEDDPVPALHRTAHLDLFKHLQPRLDFDEEIMIQLEATRDSLRWFAENAADLVILRWITYLLPLLRDLSLTEAKQFANQLKLGDGPRNRIVAAMAGKPELEDEFGNGDVRASRVVERLRDLPVEVLVHVDSTSTPTLSRLIRRYVSEWRHVRVRIGGRELRDAGYQPGPPYGRALRRVLQARLDGEVTTREEELQLALGHLREANAPRLGAKR